MKILNFFKKENKIYKKVQKVLLDNSNENLMTIEAYKLKDFFNDLEIEFLNIIWEKNSFKILFRKDGVKLMTDNIDYFKSENIINNIYEKFEHFRISDFERYGKIEIFKGKNDQFYFRVKSANNEIIASSEGYTTKQNCFKGIESLRFNMSTSQTVDLTIN